MTKKNIRPQQVAPVEREISGNYSVGDNRIEAQLGTNPGAIIKIRRAFY